jgi:hypothetical protein
MHCATSLTHLENDLASRVAGAIKFPGILGFDERQALIDVDTELSMLGKIAQGS